MSKQKYSLRVELDETLENKIKRVAARQGLQLADWVREKIALETDTEYLSFESLRAANPRLVDKLVYWTMKRSLGHQFFRRADLPHFNSLKVTASQCVQQTLNQFLHVRTERELKLIAQEYSTLTHQEKACILSFYPFSLPPNTALELTDSWFVKSDWYSLEKGEYVVLKEPVSQEFTHNGEVLGVITTNSYDAQVLNAYNMMIVDVDIEPDLLYLGTYAITPYESVALQALASYVAGEDGIGVRVYRTAAGLRYLFTNTEVDPSSWSSRKIMQALLVDPKYSKLCSFQETYRARLTPKPWRCDWDEFDDIKVCELIEVLGSDEIIDPFKPMIDFHDEQTKALSNLSLERRLLHP